VQFLVDINRELRQLYNLVISNIKNEKQNNPFMSNQNLEDVQNEFKFQELVLETKNKITLWRLFYKTASVCVL
jgi:hypothetical protein